MCNLTNKSKLPYTSGVPPAVSKTRNHSQKNVLLFQASDDYIHWRKGDRNYPATQIDTTSGSPLPVLPHHLDEPNWFQNLQSCINDARYMIDK